jgi:alanyl-tRNA synthetase
MTTLSEIRTRFLEFYKARGHAIIPSASLVPENDPTTLFTGSGMQPMVPYLLGENHPEGTRIADSQKSFRTGDIEEIGDNRHTTFFEMLGNWLLGDYFKKEQLPWIFEFLVGSLGLDPHRLYVTVFIGDEKNKLPRDEESVAIWKQLFKEKGIDAGAAVIGSEADGYARGMRDGERIFYYDASKNWWSRAGVPENMPAGEPGGPDSEMFFDFGTPHDQKFGKECHPNCDCGRFLEIGNSVFMQYLKKPDGSFDSLPKQNVDFGGGLERTAMAVANTPDIIAVCHRPIVDALEKMSGKKYESASPDAPAFRIVADHVKAASFLIGDGVLPSNTERGYFVRRLLRRAIRYADQLGIQNVGLSTLVEPALEQYKEQYSETYAARVTIQTEIDREEAKFRNALKGGLRYFEKIEKEFEKAEWVGFPDEDPPLNPRASLAIAGHAGKMLPREVVFDLYQTYGLPIEIIEELAKEKDIFIDREDFERRKLEHQNLSRTASAGAFKGGLADHSEKTTRLHTTHHLLLKALQIVLGPQVKQRGSNITSERLRMDFSYDEKMTDEQKKEAERIVNEKIMEDLPVVRSELAREDAEKLGAEHEFGQKYPDRVSVYSVGPKGATAENPQFDKAFSIEFCGGPHVTHTGEIGKFKIMKEEASSAGIRRIRGIIEP